MMSAKTYVFSDSVLCMGKIIDNPVKAWKEKIDWFQNSLESQELDRIDGEPTEFEWTSFQGHTTSKTLEEIQIMVAETKEFARAIPRTNYVNVQCPCVGTKWKQRIVCCEF